MKQVIRMSFFAGLLGLLMVGPLGAADDVKQGMRLVMFEQDGCHYCEVWDEEVGASYNLSSEGNFAPLAKRNINDRMTDGMKPVIFTPTFVLLKDGKEVGRLTGYISEDFFWGLLMPMLKKYGYHDDASKVKG